MEHFKAFYNKHKDRLFSYLLKITGDYYLAADIMQESFTRYLARYGQRNLSTALLFKIARNALSDYRRKLNRSTPIQDDTEYGGKHPEHHLMVRDEYKRVLAAMQQLDEIERDVLALVVSSNMSYREIAEITNTSEQNVKVRVHRARVKLREIMEGNSEE